MKKYCFLLSVLVGALFSKQYLIPLPHNAGKHDPYLDVNGNPTGQGNAGHLYTPETAWWLNTSGGVS